MRRFLRLSAAGLIALTAMLGATSATLARSGDVAGHVYVNNNTAGVNTISGFDRHPDGSLTPIDGTPFSAGGAGTGSPLGSAGALQESADGRYLLAVDAASNQISVLRIKHDGSLRLVEDGPVPSNGITPVSIAISDDLVYVANAGAGGSNYTGFRLGDGGHLRAIPNSTFSLPDTALPGQVLFGGRAGERGHGDDRGEGLSLHLIGTRVGPSGGPSFIDSFTVGRDGRLTAAAGSPFAAQRIGPFGSSFSPTNPSQLFVSNAHDGPGLGSVSAYTVAPDGALTPIGASPFADNQTAPCWVEVSHDGRYLFAINTGVPSISSYSVASDGSLTLLGSTAFNSPVGLRPFDAHLDPSGQFLYVVDAGAAKISAFAISGGALTELGSSPFAIPGGGAPFGIVVD